jgi:hypothetical protein
MDQQEVDCNSFGKVSSLFSIGCSMIVPNATKKRMATYDNMHFYSNSRRMDSHSGLIR